MTIEEKQAKFNQVLKKIKELQALVIDINDYAYQHEDECEVIIAADVLCGEAKLQLRPYKNRKMIDVYKLDKAIDHEEGTEFYSAVDGVRVNALYFKE